jgi:hypothetical protein
MGMANRWLDSKEDFYVFCDYRRKSEELHMRAAPFDAQLAHKQCK